MTPQSSGKHVSLPFLLATSQCGALERLFELTQFPSSALSLASCVASGTTENQGLRPSGHCHEKLMQTLIVLFLRSALAFGRFGMERF